MTTKGRNENRLFETNTKHQTESTISDNCFCSVGAIAVVAAQWQPSFGPRRGQFLLLDRVLCRCAAYGCHCFAPTRGARPFPVGYRCAPRAPDPPFPSTSHAPRNAPLPILHGPPLVPMCAPRAPGPLGGELLKAEPGRFPGRPSHSDGDLLRSAFPAWPRSAFRPER